MAQWGFYFDQTRCIGCRTCTVACMAWNEERRGDAALHPRPDFAADPAFETPAGWETGEDGAPNLALLRRYHMKEELIRVAEHEAGPGMPWVDVLYTATPCGHCQSPACAAACPTGRIVKEEKYGAVVVNGKPCAECGKCAEACPYGAPQFWRPVGPGKRDRARPAPMVKCDLCTERLDAGLKPACVAACRVRALDAGPMEELAARHPDAAPTAYGVPEDKTPAGGQAVRPNLLYKAKTPRY